MSKTKKLAVTAAAAAVGILLSFIIHMFGPGMGQFLSPLHLPAMLIGLVLGPMWGAICGIVTVLSSSLLLGGPPIYPMGIRMIFEIAAYGFFTGLFHKNFKMPAPVALLIAMILGRIVGGIATVIVLGMAGEAYGFAIFFSSYFIGTIPAIIIQMILVPLIYKALKKGGLIEDE